MSVAESTALSQILHWALPVFIDGAIYSNRDGCRVVGGSGAQLNMQFFADYTIHPGSYNDRLRSTYHQSQSCVAASYTLPTRTRFNQNETQSGPAGARYVSTYTLRGGGSGTMNMSITVGNNSAYATFLSN